MLTSTKIAYTLAWTGALDLFAIGASIAYSMPILGPALIATGTGLAMSVALIWGGHVASDTTVKQYSIYQIQRLRPDLQIVAKPALEAKETTLDEKREGPAQT